MRRREQVASSEDDNILAAWNRRATVSERLESCCNGLREFSGHLQMRRSLGSLPAVTLAGNQPDYAPIDMRDTTDSNAEQPIMRGRVLPDKHSHGLSEPRAKQPEHYKAERVFSGGKVHAANEHQSFVW